MKKLITLSILILALGSCTIQKRLYTGGYSVDFHSKHKTPHTEKDVEQSVLKEELVETGNEKRTMDSTSTINRVKEQQIMEESIVESQESRFSAPKSANKVIVQTFQRSIKTKKPQVAVSKMVSKNKQVIRYTDRGWGIDWLKVLGVVLVVGVIVLCIAFPEFAAIVDFIFALAGLIALIWVIVWLCKAIGNFPWFLTGR